METFSLSDLSEFTNENITIIEEDDEKVGDLSTPTRRESKKRRVPAYYDTEIPPDAYLMFIDPSFVDEAVPADNLMQETTDPQEVKNEDENITIESFDFENQNNLNNADWAIIQQAESPRGRRRLRRNNPNLREGSNYLETIDYSVIASDSNILQFEEIGVESEDDEDDDDLDPLENDYPGLTSGRGKRRKSKREIDPDYVEPKRPKKYLKKIKKDKNSATIKPLSTNNTRVKIETGLFILPKKFSSDYVSMPKTSKRSSYVKRGRKSDGGFTRCNGGLNCHKHDVLAPIQNIVKNVLSAINGPALAPLRMLNYDEHETQQHSLFPRIGSNGFEFEYMRTNSIFRNSMTSNTGVSCGVFDMP